VDLASLIERGDMGPWHRESSDEYKICCPDPGHDDRSPSCFVNTSKHVFICFSCGAKGHASKILRWLGISVELDAPRSDAPQKVAPVVHFIDDRVLYAWAYEPTEWVEAGFDIDVLSDHEIGFDALNQRITVPIRDRHGNLIAVSGRAVHAQQEPRYKIYKRELLDYQPAGYRASKGAVLWRHHLLPEKVERLIVVEGFKAAMWLVQQGHQNVVATMGKNVTETQEGLLRSMRVPVIIMFDADEAGRKGAEVLGINLYRSGVSVSYADMDDGLSPDDLTSGQITTALEEAVPHIRRSRPHGKLVSASKILPTTQGGAHGRRRGRRIPVQ
jgi:DNA primase